MFFINMPPCSAKASDLGDGYFGEMLDEKDSIAKVEQRKKVNHFFARHQCSLVPPKYLTLPGGSWAFERGYVGSLKSPWFIGLEKDNYIFNRSLFRMPGLARNNLKLMSTDPYGHIEAVQSDHSILLHCHLSALLAANLDSSKKLVTKVSGTWLDFNSSLHPEIEDSLPLLGNLFNVICIHLPVVVSYLACRDASSSKRPKRAFTRSEYVMHLLNQHPAWKFDLQEVFSYVSNQSSRMETVFAVASHR